MRMLPSLICVLVFLGPAMVLGQDPDSAAGMKLFQEQVRSILIHQCLECHGGKSVKGKFDLNTREALLDSGYVEEKSDSSYLIELIEHKAEPHMPFKAPKLKEAEIALIKQWIDLGAPYDKPLLDASRPVGAMEVSEKDREFWSFRPLSTVTPPSPANDNWSQTPIDKFILAKLQTEGIQPNSEANRRTLIRRIYFDLIGLPPTYEEVEAFAANASPTAYGDLIDKLLNSEHYGERWARHWLDIARFAESHGYEQDYDRPFAYYYRDFLIKAFNADMPFDQFVQWQLAGDELSPDDPLALMATGFMGAGVFPTQLTEDEFESARYDELDDMVATTGVAFLGLSVGCARCHDHKFDPIPTKDYYQLLSTFRTAIRSEIEMDLTPEANKAAREKFDTELARLKQEREQLGGTLAGKFREWLASPASIEGEGTWELPGDAQFQADQGSTFSLQPDGSWLSSGNAPAKDVFHISGSVVRKNVTAIRLEALTHDSLPHKGPGRADNGNFALGNLTVEIRHADGSTTPVKLTAARATHQQNDSTLSVAASIDSDPVSGWAIDMGGIGKDQAAVFDFESPVTLQSDQRLIVTLTLQHPNPKHALGHFRLSVTDRPQPAPEVGQQGPAADVIAAVNLLRAEPQEKQTGSHPAWDKSFDWFRSQQPDWATLASRLQELEKQGPAVKLSKVMVTSEGYPHMSHHADGRGFPHFYPEAYFLTRGDVRQKGEVAKQGFLQVLMRNGNVTEHWQQAPPSGWTRTSFRRASLANWLTDTENGAGHLLARVIVNRLWQHHFGRGIVSTPNDFGFPGERPTHPELLDWLARDLVEHGWQLKRLHKLIMLSSVYQQNGDWDETRASVDRENQFLWRRAPQRLEAEPIRDAMLQVSGRLDATMYGPGTLDENSTRRSVYFFIKRSQLIPTMMLFDWPEHLVSIGQRSSTTIAPQALMFMNSTQGRQNAEALAAHIAQKSGAGSDTAALIQETYRTVFARTPQAAEVELAMRFLTQQGEMYRGQGQSNASQLALTDLCQTLLSSNEFCYVE